MKRFWIVISIAGIAIVAVSAYQYLARPDRGDAAPAFTLPSIDGKPMSLGDLRGRPVLLHFWASWCGVCRQEFPSIERLHREVGGLGLTVVAVSEDDKKDEASLRSFLKSVPATFPVLLDADGEVADAYQSWGVPDTILIDGNGIIAWRRSGSIDWDSDDVRAKIRTNVPTYDRMNVQHGGCHG